MPSTMLEVRDVTKRFGGLAALSSVSFSLSEGEIVGIMGPNGSGKTVLFNIISGILKPDAGQVRYGESKVDLLSLPSHDRHRLGIARTFQHIRLFEGLTVLENAMVGVGPRPLLSGLLEVFRPFCHRRLERQVKATADESLLPFGERLTSRDKEVSVSLSYANRRRLEFARALASKPKLVMLDEPTAGMNPHETYELQKLIYLLRDSGVSFLIIEHKIFFLEDLVDRMVVLAQGQKIAEGPVVTVRKDPSVLKSYFGNEHVSTD